LEWFLKNILNNTDYKIADNIVENQQFDEELFYLPYIYGASDVCNTGAFVGLNSNHTYKDMLRAVFEGIVFEHNRRIEKIRDMGIKFDTAVLTGGAANSAVFCQLFADVTGVKIQTVKQSQTGSLGGAILGMAALGIYSSIEDAVNNMAEYKECYNPNKNELYDLKYSKFKSFLISNNK
jgi:L-xylulokinase